ncbi:hypothetical protein NPIL_669991 [Nephila pilipes]|uniref:Uncharacterized protein n=1 Tax=Nephila pilipes TaxID=299642 RepID=A0A8X6QXV1_NEPPI|nr:hypothetical protein NPIL_669991 [Nephila pilipes]
MDASSCALTSRNYNHVYPVSISLSLQENCFDYPREISTSESWNYEFRPSDCLYTNCIKKPAVLQTIYNCTVQDGRKGYNGSNSERSGKGNVKVKGGKKAEGLNKVKSSFA